MCAHFRIKTITTVTPRAQTKNARIGASTTNNNRMEWKASIKSEADREGGREKWNIWMCEEKSAMKMKGKERRQQQQRQQPQRKRWRCRQWWWWWQWQTANCKKTLNLLEKRPVTLHFVFRLSFEPLFQNGLVLIKHTREEKERKSANRIVTNVIYCIKFPKTLVPDNRLGDFDDIPPTINTRKRHSQQKKAYGKLLATVVNIQQTQNFYRNPKCSRSHNFSFSCSTTEIGFGLRFSCLQFDMNVEIWNAEKR